MIKKRFRVRQNIKTGKIVALITIMLLTFVLSSTSKAQSPGFVDVETIDGFSVTGHWNWSSTLKGPISKSTATLWTNQVGATAIWNPKLYNKGKVRISIYKLYWPSGNDPKHHFEIVHNDKLDTVYVDFTSGPSEWYELGVFDFSGSGNEYVKLTKDNITGNIRAGAVKFEIFWDNNDLGIYQTLYVNADKNYSPSELLHNKVEFADLKEHWAKNDVEMLAEKGLIKGISENNFNPEGEITRAEFITLIVRAIGLEGNKNDLSYNDVKYENWYVGNVGVAEKAGILKNLTSEDNFRPNNAITREEMALIIYNAVNYMEKNMEWSEDLYNFYNKFTDVSSMSDYVKVAVEKVAHLGIIKGIDEYRFNPKDNATRAHAAVMLKRFMQIIMWAGPPKDSKWELAFQDEFNGDSLNWNIWGSQNGPSLNNLASRHPENTKVKDGILSLITKKENRSGTQEWTSAHIWVKKEIFEQTYGYWEARYKYAEATGLNNAWWMNQFYDGNKGPRAFEIDINEGHYPYTINMSLHGTPKGNKRYYSDEDLSKDFHTYAVEWNEQETIYYLDTKEIARFQAGNAKLPVSPRFSTAVFDLGGPVTDALDGKSMDVDWVRVYKKNP